MANANYIMFEIWTPNQVVDWLRGLDDTIVPYVEHFMNNDIDGRRLLMLTHSDLEKLQVIKLGHQELILEAVDLLRTLRYGHETENLQHMALQLGCKARSLHNEVQAHSGENDINKANVYQSSYNPKRLSISVLSGIADLLTTLKILVSWLDRAPFEGIYDLCLLRNTILKFGIGLVTVSQRDTQMHDAEDQIMKDCGILADICDGLVMSSKDPLVVQPASLELATIRKKPGEELGMHIQSSYYGTHVISGVKELSPADLCRKIEKGDEAIQVNYQTVLGWQLKKLVNTLKEKPKEVVLLLKKRPRHISPYGPLPHRNNNNRNKSQVATLPKSLKKRRSRDGEAKAPRPFLQEYVTVSAPYEDSENKEGTDGNDTDNDVFRSGSESPQYTLPVNTDPKQRRATVSGGSPTLDRPSLVIEDLDPPTRPKSQAVNAAERDAALAALTTAESNLTNLAGHRKISRMRSNELPQTKSSLTVPDQFQIRPDATSLEPFEDSIDEDKTPIMNSENIQIRGEKDKRHGFRVTKPTPIVIDLPDTEHIQRLSKQSVLDCELADAILPKDQPQLLKMKKIDPSSNVKNSDEVKKDPQTKRVEFSSDTKDEGKEVQGPISYTHLIIGGVVQKIPSDQTQNYTCTESPTVRLRNKTPGKRLADRRISCKDLGKGDCEGWLYKRKTKDRGPLTKNWVKRWCVSKTNNLYYFKEKDDLKAEGVIHLLAFQVSPATDIKTKKFAFKVHNAGTTFYFASERQEDMSKWMNKMGLAAINYDTSNIMTTGGFIKPEPIVKAQGYGVQNVYYSESEDDDDNELGTSSTVSGSCLSLASATSKDSIATLTPTSVQNSPEKYSINKADEGRDDLAVMIRNIRKSELTIDGVDRNKTRRSQIQSSDLLTAAPSAELDKLRKLKSLHRTLKAKEHDLNEIETFLKDPVTPDKLHQFQDQHKELLPRRRSQKQRSSKNKHH